jgi:hypothetical protein
MQYRKSQKGEVSLPDLTRRLWAKASVKKPDFFNCEGIRLFHFVIQSDLKAKYL